MAGRIITLRRDTRCKECGKLLQKGTKVRGYRKENGSWIFYCLEGHGKFTNKRTLGAHPPTTRSSSRSIPTPVAEGEGPDKTLQLLWHILQKTEELLTEIRGFLSHYLATTAQKGITDGDTPLGGESVVETEGAEEDEELEDYLFGY